MIRDGFSSGGVMVLVNNRIKEWVDVKSIQYDEGNCATKMNKDYICSPSGRPIIIVGCYVLATI